MQIMILDGSIKNDHAMNITRQIIEEHFKRGGHKIVAFTLRDLHIATCCGFFCCWLKTPGVCVINDIGREIARQAVISDHWVFLTPITFGGYSSTLKKAVDRMAPILLPYFMKLKGEVRHIPRYKKQTHLIVFGSSEKRDMESENIFNFLVQRNSGNFHSASAIGKVILRADDLATVKEKIGEALSSATI